jgi:hypothetical protein
MEDHLAHWISELPYLIEGLVDKPIMENYCRSHEFRARIRRVNDEQWKMITTQLTQ